MAAQLQQVEDSARREGEQEPGHSPTATEMTSDMLSEKRSAAIEKRERLKKGRQSLPQRD